MKIKSILLIASLVFLTISVRAQFTNLDFETWGTTGTSSNDPTGWQTFNFDLFAAPNSTFQETASPGQGTSSASLVTTSGYGPVLGPFGFPDTLGGLVQQTIPYTQKPSSIDLVYKYAPVSGDSGIVFVQLQHWTGTQTIIDGQGVLIEWNTVSNWTSINIPITYFTSDTPDTIAIVGCSSIGTITGTSMPIPGSELELDAFVVNLGAPPCTGPTAGFSSTTSNLTASFTNTTTGTAPFIYFWDFGDSVGTSTAQNPSYTYSTAGTYTVCLIVIDSCSVDSICQQVTVTSGGCPSPTASFSSTPNGLSAVFLNSSSTTGSVVYAWDFGDTSGTSSLQNPTYTYSSAGAYNVCLTVTDSCGTNTFCQFVTVASGGCPAPVANFSYNANDLIVTFMNSSLTTGNVTYAWAFGDSGTSNIQNPIYTYSIAGTYIVCLTVTDSCGINTSCQTLTVSSVGCNLQVSTSSTDETAAGANDGTGTAVASLGTAPYTYTWSDPGTQTNAIATGLAPGTYTVTVIDSAGCVEAGTVLINAGSVACNISLNFLTTNETGLGANDGQSTVVATNGTTPYQYLWSDGQTTSTATSLAPGVYSVVVTDADSCIVTGTTVVQAFVCTLTGTMSSTNTDTTLTNGTASVAATGGSTPYAYLWSNGSTSSSITGLVPGIYSVLVTDADSCTFTGSVAVNALGCNMTVVVSGTAESQAGANDGSATVSITGGTAPFTIVWNTTDTTSTISGLAPGSYSVSVTDSAGCIGAGTYNVAGGPIVGIDAPEIRLAEVIVYPNPANELINFKVRNIDRPKVYIYDLSGKQLMAVDMSEDITTLSVVNLSRGIYYYRIISGSGEMMSGKFIVQK